MATKVSKRVQKKVVSHLKGLAPTCGECVGFSTEVVRDKSICKGNDVLPTAKANVACFVPNTNALRDLVGNEGAFMALAHLVSEVDDTELRTLGATIMAEKRTRKAGYQMGQKVYVRYRGLAKQNYLSNFMSAFIMYADRDMIRVTGRDGKACMTFVGKARSSVIRVEEFEPMRAQMRKKGRFTDPDVQRNISKMLRCQEEYELGIAAEDYGEVPTIDQVFKTNKVSKRGSGVRDLVSLVADIERGFFDLRKTDKKKARSRKKKGVTEVDVT